MNVVVAQSGGPTAVINASLLGVYRAARQWPQVDIVFGSLNGIEGILNDRLVNLNEQLDTDEQQTLLRQTPSAALRSCRYKLPAVEKDPAVYETIRATLEKHDIGAFFYIGGNDSMDTVDKLSTYFASVGSPICVMGVPKTIDNDLCLMDHTPGYGSAAKFVATAMWEMIRDCTVYELDSVLIVEIMGRDTGWLTAAAALPRLFGCDAPHLVYLPEVDFSAEQFLEDLREAQKKSRTVIVAVSEGVELEGLDDFQSGKVDTFGHKYLSGIGKCLEELVRDRIGCKVRSVELNILQRCAAHIASETDLEEAEQLGAVAVQAAAVGETGQVSAIVSRGDGYTPLYDIVSVREVANKVKYVPRQWINEAGNDVLPEALNYIQPLIMGEPVVLTENGLARHFIIKE
ncbi:MAG: 6-phosphofructokinase [Clostridia bacterium]|nr:6-phosphofructokinase [Clostridia bacterium]